MEGEPILPVSASEDAVLAASSDTDLASVGSPEDRDPSESLTLSDGDDRDHDQVPEHAHNGDHYSENDAVAVDDLKQRIVKQVEYYFSDENLPNDKYMLNMMKKNKQGFVPVGIIASFRKMKKLSRDDAFISSALKESAFLVVSADGKKVKRLNPLPVVEVQDHKLSTVLVENLPVDHSDQNLLKIFGDVGMIKKISIHDPFAEKDGKRGNTTLYSTKLHALVEYEEAEAAEKAAKTLNNEGDWRNGMRVKLLNRVAKYVQRRQVRTESEPNKKNVGFLSDHTGTAENMNENHGHNRDTAGEENGDHAMKEKNGDSGHKNVSYGRGRKHKHRGLNGHGHGIVACIQPTTEASKPPPGPKMPDGTRGFAMGRGQPQISGRS
ncbi:hypothetical protein SAY86_016626 [Trapa natans]|uniref:La-related protein 6A n=1 Tax=Trapa natans TaxID=22666 RepID=A0AAN7QWH2_TRANT|nr:hypothetical protein SAY86_016626 [Trapa natans]